MPQTLQALLALTLALFFVFQQQRNIVETQIALVRNELSSQATGVAVDRLEEIGAMAYDDAVKGETTISSSSELTLEANFTDDAPPVDDIDDFDGSAVERLRVTPFDTLRYAVHASVAYADEASPGTAAASSTSRTKFKKVTVTVYSLDDARPDTVRIAQSFACGSRCDW